CMAPFVLGHLIQLAPDLPGTNHKLFNFWAVLMAIYGGVALARLAVARPRRTALRRVGPVAAVVLLVPLTLSGFIDLALLKNEQSYDIVGQDRPVVAWIAEQTPPDAVFLTAPWLYETPSIAGRRIYMGWG